MFEMLEENKKPGLKRLGKRDFQNAENAIKDVNHAEYMIKLYSQDFETIWKDIDNPVKTAVKKKAKNDPILIESIMMQWAAEHKQYLTADIPYLVKQVKMHLATLSPSVRKKVPGAGKYLND